MATTVKLPGRLIARNAKEQDMIFPAQPVEFEHKYQLKGLDKGEWALQAKWDGRRGVLIPGEGLFYRSGKPVDTRPWKDLTMPETDLILDLELMRHDAIPLDIIVDEPLEKRYEMMLEQNIVPGQASNMPGATKHRTAKECLWIPKSFEEINAALNMCLMTRQCDGVVLKRISAGNRGYKKENVQREDWVKVKREIFL